MFIKVIKRERETIMDNYSRVNYELLRSIPPDAKVVVEIGCGSGSLGEKYRRINPNCNYIGMEINPQAAASATTKLNKVIVGDAEKIELDEENIDCLIYGDILEYLIDPWSMVKRHVDHLKLGGEIIACIPNIQHWTVISGLIKGNWYDQKTQNNLRFFTMEGIRELFAQAGMTIVEIRARKLNQAGFSQFKEIFEPMIAKFGLDSDKFFTQAEAFQYVVRASKGEAQKPRVFIQSLLGETKVCARVRIIEPHNFLATIPGIRIKNEVKTAQLSSVFQEKKIFIWQRMLLDDIYKQQELIRRGYLILAEIDDDPRRWQRHLENNFFTFRSCHGVQVSTEPLADFLRQYNPNVAVFKNQLAYLPETRKYEENRPVTIFFGALNREDDWWSIMPELNRILHQSKKEIKVIVIHDRKFFEAIEIPHKEFLPFCSYRDYEAALRASDIAILPLQPNQFNMMKSDLKFLECAAHGVAVLASPTVYVQSIQDGETGFIYRNTAEFAEKLITLIEDIELRRHIARNAYSWVAQYRLLCQHYKERYHWYLDMLGRLHKLNESLKDRVSDIFFR